MRNIFASIVALTILFGLGAADQFHNHDHFHDHDSFTDRHEHHCPVFSLKSNLPELPVYPVLLIDPDDAEDSYSFHFQNPHVRQYANDIDLRAPPFPA
ncbi:MAG: hypothetical protein GF404_08755 [candidate division Zixibacteria bacterium]|nr:hypothetical protein [candidate division Zixibacteria bacterium]